jgi:hypothetical protein
VHCMAINGIEKVLRRSRRWHTVCPIFFFHSKVSILSKNHRQWPTSQRKLVYLNGAWYKECTKVSLKLQSHKKVDGIRPWDVRLGSN